MLRDRKFCLTSCVVTTQLTILSQLLGSIRNLEYSLTIFGRIELLPTESTSVLVDFLGTLEEIRNDRMSRSGSSHLYRG